MGDTIILAVLPIKQRNDISEYGVTFFGNYVHTMVYTALETGSISIDVLRQQKICTVILNLIALVI